MEEKKIKEQDIENSTTADVAAVKVESEPKVVAKKGKRTIFKGQAHIQCTYNNTIVTITDMQGDAIAWSSPGRKGYKGSKQATPYAAQIAVEEALKSAQECGLKTVIVKIKGPGAGRESAVRAVSSFKDITITSIKDVTPVAHNGCRPPKRRRV
jgi:small subunit ribosomal protein S11